ncbi:murein hydrolase activator NlpD [Erwinia billingiae]|uniref:murein hydrolase activator NlpD n=1 Tax=Erwinia billingiae TaxID=182337 RepID=UPI00069D50ED|nr:murein hydrolase activator NlpD [Erwinia billingiae]MBN7122540.1 peptidase [Erwinia billingiae]PRB59266.1 murein hydrolase activator NlpD [Erwinia billingiae]QEW31034.1 murein hydrolase activator NlpD [Erwinia billingiae]
MSTGSPMFKLRRIAAVSLVGFWLAGCSSDNSTQAPISSVGSGGGSGGMLSGGSNASSGSGNSNSGVLSSANSGNGGYTAPPASISANSSNVVSAPQNISSSNAAPQENVVTENGHIVYNRSYGNIPKGSYGGQTYTVKRGDTLFYIAWITGNDFRDLAQRNNVAAPYALNVGQQLQVSNGSGGTLTGGNAVTAADASAGGVAVQPSAPQNQGGAVAHQPVITYSEDSGKPSEGKMLPSSGTTTVATTTAPVTAPTVSSTTNSSTPVGSWRWPTDGKIIDNFSASEGGNKGIDIAGSRGQPVISTASGRVVYAGNALRGYGNLIIIKHNDDYLSAYAHNDTMLVREQQEVKAGQKIATMGSTGTSSVRLHFEIRYKGKSVNPLRYLPQR